MRSWMETNHEALLQNLNAEQLYAKQHFRSLQPSAALLRRGVLSRVQAEEVLVNLRYTRQKLKSIADSAGVTRAR